MGGVAGRGGGVMVGCGASNAYSERVGLMIRSNVIYRYSFMNNYGNGLGNVSRLMGNVGI